MKGALVIVDVTHKVTSAPSAAYITKLTLRLCVHGAETLICRFHGEWVPKQHSQSGFD